MNLPEIVVDHPNATRMAASSKGLPCALCEYFTLDEIAHDIGDAKTVQETRTLNPVVRCECQNRVCDVAVAHCFVKATRMSFKGRYAYMQVCHHPRVASFRDYPTHLWEECRHGFFRPYVDEQPQEMEMRPGDLLWVAVLSGKADAQLIVSFGGFEVSIGSIQEPKDDLCAAPHRQIRRTQICLH
jgi:hypothetical protein